MFIDKLIKDIKVKKSTVIVGLDPRINLIPNVIIEKYFKEYGKTFKAVGEAIFEFNKEIIDNLHDVVVGVKPQIAFYEQYGLEGLEAYIRTCDYAHKKNLIVIGDVKRGDIGTTSQAYSNAHLGNVSIAGKVHKSFGVDSITVNPYLGEDCLKEFIKDIDKYGKGMFVLIKTSNKSSNQIQNLEIGNKKIYEIVAEMVANLNNRKGSFGYSSVGAVVGANYSEEAESIRRLLPNSYFLVPGYGAQGGKAKDIVNSFNKDGLGAVVNSSRGIIYAYQKENYSEEEFALASRKAAINMKNDINKVLEKNNKIYW